MSEKSAVWNFFKAKDGGCAICQVCATTIKNKGGNTSNLLRHLQNKHPVQYSTINPRKRKAGYSVTSEKNVEKNVSSSAQPSISSAFAKATPLMSGSQRHQAITDAITHFLCKDNIPFNTVDRPGFRHLLNVLEPRYEIPNKTTFSKSKVVKLYDVTRESVMGDLGEIDFFASTADMWSSHGLTPYLGYTLHWIDCEWNLRTRNIGRRYIPDDHTAVILAQSTNDMLLHWKLDEAKQVAITTDNGANIKKACTENTWMNVLCFGHNLHLAITNTLAKEKRASRALGVCKRVVSAFAMSWKRRRNLTVTQLQEEPGKKVKKLASVTMDYYEYILHNDLYRT